MDISPFTAGVFGMGDTGSYKPTGVTAFTPSESACGRCALTRGHRTPDLAVQCGSCGAERPLIAGQNQNRGAQMVLKATTKTTKSSS